MNITDLTIVPIKDDKSCRAHCEATFDSAFTLTGIQIREGKKGVFVKFPSVVRFTDEAHKKEASNRILATYIINHCIDKP